MNENIKATFTWKADDTMGHWYLETEFGYYVCVSPDWDGFRVGGGRISGFLAHNVTLEEATKIAEDYFERDMLKKVHPDLTLNITHRPELLRKSGKDWVRFTYSVKKVGK